MQWNGMKWKERSTNFNNLCNIKFNKRLVDFFYVYESYKSAILCWYAIGIYLLLVYWIFYVLNVWVGIGICEIWSHNAMSVPSRTSFQKSMFVVNSDEFNYKFHEYLFVQLYATTPAHKFTIPIFSIKVIILYIRYWYKCDKNHGHDHKINLCVIFT